MAHGKTGVGRYISMNSKYSVVDRETKALEPTA